MRSLGMMTMLSVAATAAAPSAPRHQPAGMTTAKSVQAFADCFINSQDQRSAPWWFVPKAGGGTFSNRGAAGVAKPYFLVISERGAHREIRLDNVATASPAAEGVSQCA
ncbi:MAG TPA: hypothetical protein VJT70_03240 [Sphingomicrobium sp.]|nr:hypothetical protein [Sphingomicrobium sp.]